MSFKRWIAAFLAITVLLLCGFAALTYVADPLLQFRPESGVFTSYAYTDIYSNPGIARQYDYDAVLVGTSMMENTYVSVCNALFGCDMVRLTYSGGTAYNMKRILDICFQREEKPKTVFWGLDEFQLISDWDTPRYPLPEYLYEKSPEGTLSYLLNLDIFYNFTWTNYQHTRSGLYQMAARGEETFTGDYSTQGALSNYTRPEQVAQPVSETYYLENARLNLENNILPLVESNPETEFVFIFPPYSILYWDNEMRRGTFDALMAMLEESVGTLLQYDNVRLYFYQDWWELVLDLDNYKDYSHYATQTNTAIMERVARDEGRLTRDNYENTLGAMSEFIHSYDFESIFVNQE